METETLDQAVVEYQELLDNMVKLGKTSHLGLVQHQIVEWYTPLVAAIEVEQHAFIHKVKGTDRALYGPFLVQLTADKLAVITVHALINRTVTAGQYGAPFASMCRVIAEAIEAEVNLRELKNKYGKDFKHIYSKLTANGTLSTRKINMRARLALEDGQWDEAIKMKLGAVLINTSCQALEAKFTDAYGNERIEPAFTHSMDQLSYRTMMGHVRLHPELKERFMSAGGLSESNPRNLPMLVEPRPWTKFDKGGFLKLRSRVMRFKGSRSQVDALRDASLDRVFEGLNSLGRVRWRINAEVLDSVQQAWDAKLEVGDLPKQVDYEVPPVGEWSAEQKEEELDSWRKANYLHKRAKQMNSDLHSLRCDTQIKLGIAQRFKDEEAFYFPFNMDFRGRAYPIPPNLNHLGDDMSRGVLTFAEKRELGERGVFWLKVQLANLAGFDKASFADRAAWTEGRMAEIYDSARRPIDGDRFWATCENPWQALATCKEVVRAYESTNGHPERFLSDQPIHMDGSCNGLQHYAALGRDEEGGREVNLLDGEKPRDVYSGVCAIVVAKLAALAKDKPKGPGANKESVKTHELAKLVAGLIDRKVVKQTVMTSVYGVTFIGAKRQIQNRLEEKFENVYESPDEAEQVAYECSGLVATVTMDALHELFQGARNTMAWLGNCARLVSQQGHPMTWVTPLGLPVSQPYRRGGIMTVRTCLQTVQVVHQNDDLNVNVQRQRSAFPPNFVHSLDSTHMLITALKMEAQKIPFTAVHDSYWAHGCNVDEMNRALRSSFVELYSQPILEDLLLNLRVRFPKVDFPEIPERGSLKLPDVRNSTYFFN